jgi:protein-S-isoprenylcysteine O-methyltransferase Ste14
VKPRVAKIWVRAMLGVVVAILAWCKVCGVVAWGWLAVLSPLMLIGGVHVVIDWLVFVAAELIVGQLIVDRSDAKARRAVTIRKAR